MDWDNGHRSPLHHCQHKLRHSNSHTPQTHYPCLFLFNVKLRFIVMQLQKLRIVGGAHIHC